MSALGSEKNSGAASDGPSREAAHGAGRRALAGCAALFCLAASLWGGPAWGAAFVSFPTSWDVGQAFAVSITSDADYDAPTVTWLKRTVSLDVEPGGDGRISYALLGSYVRDVKPDLLSWDTYYYSTTSGPSPDKVVTSLLNNQTWQAQREYALKGLTGDGSSPILYGQYLDYNWDANVSASQKAIVPSLGLATGQKWFGLFRMEYNGYDRSSIIDHDGAPTRSFYEFTRIFRSVRYIGEYTKALDSTFVALKPGQYDGRGEAPVLSGYRYGNFASGDEAVAANQGAGLVDMSVTNTGSVNGGKPGDVVVGYFDQLGGLEAAKSAEIFGESTTVPKGFMVVNALTGTTKFPSMLLDPRTDDGSFAETAQDITLTVKKPSANSRLMLVDPSPRPPPRSPSATGRPRPSPSRPSAAATRACSTG